VDKLMITAIEVLVPLATALIVAGIGYLVAFLQAKTAAIKFSVLRTSLDAALMEAGNVAIEAVQYVKQTFSDDIKAASADGKLTKDEAAAALAAAKNYFLAHITEHSASILIKAVANWEEWIAGLIETKVADAAEKFRAEPVAG
jgi:dGTP triphosphohydrolase